VTIETEVPGLDWDSPFDAGRGIARLVAGRGVSCGFGDLLTAILRAFTISCNEAGVDANRTIDFVVVCNEAAMLEWTRIVGACVPGPRRFL
jgi:hypothetical protein